MTPPKLNYFDLTKEFWDYCREHTGRVRPVHGAVYFYLIERFNSFHWPEELAVPSRYSMEVIGIKDTHTFHNALRDLELFGFIRCIQKATNQNKSAIYAMLKNHTATPQQPLSNPTILIHKRLKDINNKKPEKISNGIDLRKLKKENTYDY